MNSAAVQSVREALRARGLSQVKAGKILGFSQPAVSRRLNGEVSWNLDELQVLAEHLGITVPELLEPPAVLVDEPTAVAS